MADYENLLRAARLNVARSQQAVKTARLASQRCAKLCEQARQQLADDIALLESLKASHERTGIVRG
jgi:hypothetical protein